MHAHLSVPPPRPVRPSTASLPGHGVAPAKPRRRPGLRGFLGSSPTCGSLLTRPVRSRPPTKAIRHRIISYCMNKYTSYSVKLIFRTIYCADRKLVSLKSCRRSNHAVVLSYCLMSAMSQTPKITTERSSHPLGHQIEADRNLGEPAMTPHVHDPKTSVKVVGSSGQISLGKEYAGRQVLVEEREPGVWLVRTALVIPENEAWLHAPQAKQDLQEALAWAQDNAPVESDLDALTNELGNEEKKRRPRKVGSK